MSHVPLIALVLVLVGGLAAACGDDGDAPPAATGPTTLSLTKTVIEASGGEFRFTLELTNRGDNAAVSVATSDVWDEGLEVTEIGSVDGQQPKAIGDFGLEFLIREFPAGKTVRLDYTVRCRQSGEWENVAVASSANAEAMETSVTVVCP